MVYNIYHKPYSSNAIAQIGGGSIINEMHMHDGHTTKVTMIILSRW